MSEGLLIDTDAGVRVLTINRPAKLGALNHDVVDAIAAAVHEAGADPGVGAIVLTGRGRAFSAGGDIGRMGQSADAEQAAAGMRRFQAPLLAIWNSPLPVIACVNGLAFGAGFNLVLGCDLIVASADATFCQVFTGIGLAPDVGGAWSLPRAVGRHKALELMLLNPRITAAQAHALGFVADVQPDAAAALGSAMAMATTIAAGPRAAHAETKRLVNATAALDLRAALDLEVTTQSALLVGAESIALRRRFLDR